jgi:hypothetical protein
MKGLNFSKFSGERADAAESELELFCLQDVQPALYGSVRGRVIAAVTICMAPARSAD